MGRRKKQTGRITVGGNLRRPGITGTQTIVLTQPRRFGIDIADMTAAIHAFENVDYSRRFKLYDLYSDILMDTHLSSVIDKRVEAVLALDIEFQRDGKPDERINEQLQSPWFRRCIEDILAARWWGFSLMQFYREGPWINYDLIPRKHADPVRRLILRHQTDITGTPWDEYPDLLFVGDKDDMGLLAKAAPWVIYKRNDMADWAQFAEVFGMPIQEYTYETDDDEARQRAIEDATGIGSLGVFIHGKDTELNLREAGNKSGSADLYDKLCERCNSEISKLVLGNTLTTEASKTGTQALGTVHKKVEDKKLKSDCRFLLNVLNYDMTDIFQRVGIDTAGGKFCFPEQKETDTNTEMTVLSTLKRDFNLPIDDDFLYEKFGIEKPKNYKQLKAEAAQKTQTPASPVPPEGKKEKPEEKPDKEDEAPTGRQKRNFMAWLKSFFDHAPHKDGAALNW